MKHITVNDKEMEEIFLKACVFLCLAYDRPFKIHNVFIILITRREAMTFMREAMCCDSDYEVVKVFIEFSPDIAKNKAISNFLSDKKNARIIRR